MRKRILVTGGAGFIGSHTVDLLLAEGHDVCILDNFSTGKLSNLPEGHPRLQIIVSDIADAQVLRNASENVDAVLHLAAQVSVQKSIEDPVGSCAQNIQNFIALLEVARRRDLRVVYASSAAVYGDPEILPLRESDPVRPISPYGLEKYSNELYAELYEKMYGLSHLGLRYFNVYGQRQDPRSLYSGVISRFIDQMLTGKPLSIRGDGLQERDFIHVSDIARANVAALFSDTRGVVNIASGTKTTILDLASILVGLHGTGDLSWAPAVPGDIRHSRADVTAMSTHLVQAKISLKDGLRQLLGARISAVEKI